MTSSFPLQFMRDSGRRSCTIQIYRVCPSHLGRPLTTLPITSAGSSLEEAKARAASRLHRLHKITTVLFRIRSAADIESESTSVPRPVARPTVRPRRQKVRELQGSWRLEPKDRFGYCRYYFLLILFMLPETRRG